MPSVFDFKVKTISGEEISLEKYKGQLMLIVNTASQCGYTPQYTGLQKLQEALSSKVVVLGFPCNQFGAQEPAGNDEIKEFCDTQFRVRFPLFSKVDVNGDKADPLFNFLKESLPGVLGTKNIKWNFTKFLVGKDGVPIKRYAPQMEPSEIEKEIKALL